MVAIVYGYIKANGDNSLMISDAGPLLSRLGPLELFPSKAGVSPIRSDKRTMPNADLYHSVFTAPVHRNCTA